MTLGLKRCRYCKIKTKNIGSFRFLYDIVISWSYQVSRGVWENFCSKFIVSEFLITPPRNFRMHPTWARDQRGISVGQNHNVYIMNAKETGARVHDFFMFYVQEGSTRVHTTTTTPDEGRFTVKSLKSSPWIQHLSHQENAQIRHSMVLRIWARSSICLQNSLVVMLMISLLPCCCMRLAWTSGPIKANGVIQPQTQKHFHHSMIWFENTLHESQPM